MHRGPVPGCVAHARPLRCWRGWLPSQGADGRRGVRDSGEQSMVRRDDATQASRCDVHESGVTRRRRDRCVRWAVTPAAADHQEQNHHDQPDQRSAGYVLHDLEPTDDGSDPAFPTSPSVAH